MEHPIVNWRVPTKILYGENDDMTDFDTIRHFADKFYCDLNGNERWRSLAAYRAGIDSFEKMDKG